ncbi:hypothetical protein [Bartonella birtlesii]|uniref:Uncharacterized protein n=1 Tax=Bartonella birtlesii LL-WM9 TaxID=1094552 RepID=J0Q200_9HYPH|nr:hypothetical protein [Bartonella birtlesii]EJF76584.1 hypothetical protein ME7_00841 [Bartonella birtlesii LL-WM9]
MFLITKLFGLLALVGLIIIAVLNSMLIIGIYYFFVKRIRVYLKMDKELNERR